jgi:hypothetical protein
MKLLSDEELTSVSNLVTASSGQNSILLVRIFFGVNRDREIDVGPSMLNICRKQNLPIHRCNGYLL